MLKDGLSFFLLSSSTSFFTAAARNVLFHVLDIRTPFINWLEQFSLLVLLSCLIWLQVIPPSPSPSFKSLSKPTLFYVLESFLSNIAHSQFRTGQLFTMRCFDFIFTLTILHLHSSHKSNSTKRNLLLLSVFASISWFDPSHMEYTFMSIFASIILPFVKALRVISLKNTFHKTRCSVERFAHMYTLICSVLLFPFAFISLVSRNVEVTASWESIDYALMSLAPLWFASALYADLWMITQLPIELYIIAEHTRMTAASIGQWILQNMAHPSIIAFSSKIVFISTLIYSFPTFLTSTKRVNEE